MYGSTTRHFQISRDADDRDDDKFHFESIARYNPLMKVPELSPSSPQFSKYYRALPTRFKLPRICNYSGGANPKYKRGKNRLKKDKRSKNSQSKSKYWDKDENIDDGQSYNGDFYRLSPIKSSSSSSHRSSSVPSSESNKHSSIDNNGSKHSKFYKTLIIKENSSAHEYKSEVKKEFRKMKSRNQNGSIIFTLKGTDKRQLLDNVRNEIEQICVNYGYLIKAMNSGTVIECQKDTEEDSFESSSNVHRTTLLVPCSTEENSLCAIKKRLQSLYNGIVTFKPIRKRYNTLAPMEFLNKVVEICRENGYSAKITNIQAQTIDCDMRNKIQSNKLSPTKQILSNIQTTKLKEADDSKLNKGYTKVDVPWNSPIKAESIVRSYLSDGTAKGKIVFAPSVGLYSVINMSNFPDKIVEICSNEYHFQAIKFPNQTVECNKSVKCFNNNTNVNQSTNSLSNGNISSSASLPSSVGLSLSSTMPMSSYNNTSSISTLNNALANKSYNSSSKNIQLPLNDRKACEQIVRNYFESGKAGTVSFSCGNNRDSGDLCSIISDICQEYNFRCKVVKCQIDNQSFSVLNNQFVVECNVTPRNYNQLFVKIPSDNVSAMKTKLQRYFESGFIGKIDFSPITKNHSTFLFFAQNVSSICDSYGFNSQVIESQDTVRCIVYPQYFDLSNYLDDSQIEQRVKNVLTSGIKDSYIVFSVKRKTVPENQKSAEKIAKYCKSLGFQAKVSDFYFQRICVNYLGNKNKNKQSSSKSYAASSNGNSISSHSYSSSSPNSSSVNLGYNSNVIKIKLPSYDPKSAEIMIRRQLSSTFVGTVQFSPKGTSFSSTIMPEYPQRIVNICSEYGFKATVLNQRLQIVECRMKQFKYL